MALLTPPFWFVDRAAIPDHAGTALVLRLIMTPLVLFVAVQARKPQFERWATAAGLAVATLFIGYMQWVSWVAEPPIRSYYLGWGALMIIGMPPFARWGVRTTTLYGLVTAVVSIIHVAVRGDFPFSAEVFFPTLYGTSAAFSAMSAFQIERATRRGFRQQKATELEQARSDFLLLNILPEEIARRLKDADATHDDTGGSAIADRFPQVTVLFADIVGFTPLSARLTADELVTILNDIFVRFDDLADELGVEKIKTIGDAYMVASGLPRPRHDHAAAAADMALGMQRIIKEVAIRLDEPLAIRVGLHTGPVVAGVIGKRKFIYDLWGDTVNIAARMESHGVSGEVQVTGATRDALQANASAHRCDSRGAIEVKGKGEMEVFLVRAPAEAPPAAAG